MPSPIIANTTHAQVQGEVSPTPPHLLPGGAPTNANIDAITVLSDDEPILVDVEIQHSNPHISLPLQEQLPIYGAAKEMWAKGRRSYTSYAKTKARADHMSNLLLAQVIPEWAYGLTPIPEFLLTGEEALRMVAFKRQQAQESLTMVTTILRDRAKDHKDAGNAYMHTFEALIRNTDIFEKVCSKSSELTSTQFDRTAKKLKRKETQMQDTRVSDDEIVALMQGSSLKPFQQGRPKPAQNGQEVRLTGKNKPSNAQNRGRPDRREPQRGYRRPSQERPQEQAHPWAQPKGKQQKRKKSPNARSESRDHRGQSRDNRVLLTNQERTQLENLLKKAQKVSPNKENAYKKRR